MVDSEGEPLEGVAVRADTLRGNRAVYWQTLTDTAGRFVWTEAPDEQVLFAFGYEGFKGIVDFAMKPSEREHLISMEPLHPPLTVFGDVIDSATGKPIEWFSLIPGTRWSEGGTVYWDRRRARTFSDGSYEHSFPRTNHPYFVRIEAEGYKPAVSRPFKGEEGEQSYDFALEE